MKINKKGITIVEMLVSIALISIVLVFLLRLLLTLGEMDDKSLSMLEYEEKTAVIIGEIQDYIKNLNNCNFTSTNTQLTIACPNMENEDYLILDIDQENKKMTLENHFNRTWNESTRTMEYKANAWQFPDDATLNNINLVARENLQIATINIKDDKGNIYPIEISYYKTNS